MGCAACTLWTPILRSAEIQTHCLCHPLSSILLFVLQARTDAVHSQRTANTNVLSPHCWGSYYALKSTWKKRDRPYGWKREVQVVITQLSTLPPKLDLSFLLRVKGRDGSPCIHPSPWGARQGHAIRTVKGDPAVKRSDCSSLRMSSRAFLFILPSGIQIDYVQFTSGKRSGFFFFFFVCFKSTTPEFNLAVNCALFLAQTNT